jgi:riboflavin biosynthesis pyrimidine reductase
MSHDHQLVWRPQVNTAQTADAICIRPTRKRTKWLRRRGLIIIICIARARALATALAAGLRRRLLARLLLLGGSGCGVSCLLLRLLCGRIRKAAAADHLNRLVCAVSTHSKMPEAQQPW